MKPLSPLYDFMIWHSLESEVSEGVCCLLSAVVSRVLLLPAFLAFFSFALSSAVRFSSATRFPGK
jgi:hypothetical protein